MSNFWRISSIIMALLVLPNKVPAKDANVTINELAAIITAQRTAVRSMQGSFVAQTSADSLAKASNLTKGLVETSSIDFAWSKEKRYIKSNDQMPSGRAGELLRVSAANVFDGREFRRREQKTFLIQKEKSSVAEGNQFMNGLFWPIADDRIKAAIQDPEKKMSIPYCFRASGWEVGNSHAAIDGVPCIVVEKRKLGRRYFFAPSRGYCLVRAEFDRPKSETKHEVFEYKDIKEVSRGFYLPMEITEIADICDEQGNATGKLTTRLVARNIQINNVPESVFVLKARAGDRVIDNIRGLTYHYVPPDDNTLDASAKIAARQSAFSSHRRKAARYYGLIFLGGIAIGLGAVFGRRWWSRKKRTAS
ncbi:MAG: hypothetical protein ACREBW_10225 [Candidatus Micrarchaeaceae archaeon]